MSDQKICTMNCHPPEGDPRTKNEMQATCDDCIVPAKSKQTVQVWVAKRSVINTGLWVLENDTAATLGKPEILGFVANDYHEGGRLRVTLEYIHE